MISVIIPLFNAENTIIAALDSVKDQTFGTENFEILVINDGSTDQSKIVVEKYIAENSELNIILIDQENKGVSAARNVGFKKSKGEYIALLDSDDVWLPTKTEKQLNIIYNSKDKIDLLASKRINQKILFPYKVEENDLAEITFRKLLFRNEAQPSTVLFKRKILENTGYFDDKQRYAEDVNYFLKISEKNKMYILNEELVNAGGGKRTFGVSGLSSNLIEMEKGFQKNLLEMLQLKRINQTEYILYFLFYKMKYILRKIRSI